MKDVDDAASVSCGRTLLLRLLLKSLHVLQYNGASLAATGYVASTIEVCMELFGGSIVEKLTSA